MPSPLFMNILARGIQLGSVPWPMEGLLTKKQRELWSELAAKKGLDDHVPS